MESGVSDCLLFLHEVSTRFTYLHHGGTERNARNCIYFFTRKGLKICVQRLTYFLKNGYNSEAILAWNGVASTFVSERVEDGFMKKGQFGT